MDEMIYTIGGSFNETDDRMYGNITVDWVTTSHYIMKKSTTDARAAMLVMMADALGFEPAEVLDFENLEIKEMED